MPYRGTAPLLAAGVAGEVQMLVDPTTTSLPLVQGGRLRALAVTSAKRFAKLLDGARAHRRRGRLSEAGKHLLARRGGAGRYAGREIINKLNAAFREENSSSPATHAVLANLGAEIKIGTPAEFGDILAKESRIVD